MTITVVILHGSSCVGKSYVLGKSYAFERLEMDDTEFWKKDKATWVGTCFNCLKQRIEANGGRKDMVVTCGGLPLPNHHGYQQMQAQCNIVFKHMLILLRDIEELNKNIKKRGIAVNSAEASELRKQYMWRESTKALHHSVIYRIIVVEIRNVHSRRFLNIANGGTRNGTNVQTFGNTLGAAGNHSCWIMYDVGGQFEIQNAHSGRFLNIANGGTGDGTNVRTFGNTLGAAGGHSRWITYDVGGRYEFQNVHSGGFLNIAKGETENGTNVQTFGNKLGAAGNHSCWIIHSLA